MQACIAQMRRRFLNFTLLLFVLLSCLDHLHSLNMDIVMQRKTYLINALILMFCLSGVQAAPWYVSLGLGHTFSGKNNVTGTQDNYFSESSSAPIYNISVGREFDVGTRYFSHFALSLNANFASFKEKGLLEPYKDPRYNTYQYGYTINSSSLLLAYQGDFMQYKQWTPHVTVALGMSQNTASDYAEIASPDIIYPRTNDYQDKSELQLAYQLGVGVAYQVMKKIRISADVNYLNLGKASLGNNHWKDAGPSQSLNHLNVMLTAQYSFK